MSTCAHTAAPQLSPRACTQVLQFDLNSPAPDPSTFDFSTTVAGVKFQASTVRVVMSSPSSTDLLVGGLDNTFPRPPNAGIVIAISVVAGMNAVSVSGSIALPSSGSGVTALSQTSALVPGYVLASTDDGIYKCARVTVCGQSSLYGTKT